jgi:hypothetical protein
MEKKTYSKVYTQFETQAMAFGRLKVELKGTPYFVRGYDGYITVFKTTEDSNNPLPVLKVIVRSSTGPAEVGFFKKEEHEWLLIGMDIAWKIAEHVKPILSKS